MATIDSYDFKGKRAIVRVDFNVPLDENGKITDDTRIRGALPTLKKVLADGGSLVIMSHMGKPKGKVNPKLSLDQIKDAVAKALGTDVEFAPDCAAAADMAAAAIPMPCCRRSEAYSVSRMAVLASRPISMISPVCI